MVEKWYSSKDLKEDGNWSLEQKRGEMQSSKELGLCEEKWGERKGCHKECGSKNRSRRDRRLDLVNPGRLCKNHTFIQRGSSEQRDKEVYIYALRGAFWLLSWEQAPGCEWIRMLMMEGMRKDRKWDDVKVQSVGCRDSKGHVKKQSVLFWRWWNL